MRKNKLFQALLVSGVLVLTAGVVSCNGSNNDQHETVKPGAITIEAQGNATTLEAGKTLKLTATVTPEGADASVTWSSSDNKIATVAEDGTVTGVKEGLVIIKATSKTEATVSKEIALTITPEVLPDPESITITAEGGVSEVEVGQKLQLSAKVSPEKAEQGVTWISNDTEKATVSAGGLVNALKAGEVEITAVSKKVATVVGKIKLGIVAGETPLTQDWDKIEFSNHQAFLGAEKETPVKVKGVVTKVLPVYTNKQNNNVYNYYIQSGDEGFTIREQLISVAQVEVGKVYEIGGFKKYASGCNSISNVEYVKEIEEKITANTIDISEATDLSYAGQIANMGAQITLNGAVVDQAIPDVTNTKGYNIKLRKGESKIDVRVGYTNMSAEDFAAIGEKVKNYLPGQVVSVTGIMTSFGYGKPGSQIEIYKDTDIDAAELDNQGKVDLAVTTIALPHTVDTDVKTIELPTSIDTIANTTLAWTSNKENIINATTGAITTPSVDTDVTLTLKATAGDKTATKDFIVTVLAADTIYEEAGKLDFEDALPGNKYGCSDSKSGYKNGNVTLGGHEWALNNALIGGAEDDRREGTWSARMQTSGDDNSITLNDAVKFDTVEFLLGTYGKNALGSKIQISYAVGTGDFVTLDRVYEVNNYNLIKVRATLPVEKGAEVRVRISAVKGFGQRVNVDNIRLLTTK